MRERSDYTRLTSSFAVSSTGNRIAALSDSTIHVWDARSGHPLYQSHGGQQSYGQISCLSFAGGDDTIISFSSRTGSFYIWHTDTGERLTFKIDAALDSLAAISTAAMSPEGESTAILYPFSIEVVKVPTTDALRDTSPNHTKVSSATLALKHWARPGTNTRFDRFHVAFSSDRRILASGSHDGTLDLWDLCTREVRNTFQTAHTTGVKSMAFSPDGRTVVTTGFVDCNMWLWDVHTGHSVGRSLTGHTSCVNAVAFSPDGSIIVSGSDDHTVRVWNMHTHRELCAPLEGHMAPIVSLAFTSEGKTIVSVSEDGTIRLWETPTQDMFSMTLENQRVASTTDTSLLSWPFQLGLRPGWSTDLEKKGWIVGSGDEPILWVPEHARHRLMTPHTRLILGVQSIYLDFSLFKQGDSWTECYTPNPEEDTMPKFGASCLPPPSAYYL